MVQDNEKLGKLTTNLRSGVAPDDDVEPQPCFAVNLIFSKGFFSNEVIGILTMVSVLEGSTSDSNPGACGGVLLPLHSRIVIFSNMNFLDEVL